MKTCEASKVLSSMYSNKRAKWLANPKIIKFRPWWHYSEIRSENVRTKSLSRFIHFCLKFTSFCPVLSFFSLNLHLCPVLSTFFLQFKSMSPKFGLNFVVAESFFGGVRSCSKVFEGVCNDRLVNFTTNYDVIWVIVEHKKNLKLRKKLNA